MKARGIFSSTDFPALVELISTLILSPYITVVLDTLTPIALSEYRSDTASSTDFLKATNYAPKVAD